MVRNKGREGGREGGKEQKKYLECLVEALPNVFEDSPGLRRRHSPVERDERNVREKFSKDHL